jgi:excisionase family DNA binding protein
LSEEINGRWITLKEAAAHLNVSTSYLYQKGDSVGVPRYKIGNKFRYKLSDLDTWVQSQGRE